KFYKDGDYKLALIEFRRAYDLAPTYKVLFNIGQVNFQLNNYADAQRAFEQYMKDGGSQVPGPRRAEVEKALADLKARTAYVTVKTNVEGATVSIDGRSVGATPLPSKLLIDAGEHRIIAVKEGFLNGERAMSLAGGDDVAV